MYKGDVIDKQEEQTWSKILFIYLALIAELLDRDHTVFVHTAVTLAACIQVIHGWRLLVEHSSTCPAPTHSRALAGVALAVLVWFLTSPPRECHWRANGKYSR